MLTKQLLQNALLKPPGFGALPDAALADCRDGRKRAAAISFVIHISHELLRDWINQEERLQRRQK